MKTPNTPSIPSLIPAESTAINYLRVLAFMCILSDHFFVFLEIPHISSILVVGVQLFFIISGYLYGSKNITNWGGWFLSRFKKLYIPYLLFIVMMMVVYAVMLPQVINVKNVLLYILNLQGLQFFSARMGGGIHDLSHLWFLTIYAICILITPICQKIRKYNLIAIALVVCVFALNSYYLHQTILYIALYALAYFMAFATPNVRYVIALFGLVACIVCLPIVTWYDMDLFTWPSMVLKCAGGLMIFILSLHLFHHFQWKRTNCVTLVLGVYSYEAYIVHPILLKGPLALTNGSYSFIANLLIFIIGVCILSFILKFISTKLVQSIFL